MFSLSNIIISKENKRISSTLDIDTYLFTSVQNLTAHVLMHYASSLPVDPEKSIIKEVLLFLNS